MDPLRSAFAMMMVAFPSPVLADAVARWQPLIAEASQRCGIPESWIVQVMRAESAGITSLDGRPIRSPKGAIGLMQLMPGTWNDMRARLGLGTDPDDPRDNIIAGTCYLRLMYDRFGYPGLFSAYNAGPGRYAGWLAGRATLPAETIVYLDKVAGPAGAVPVPGPVANPPSLFVVRRELEKAPPSVVTEDPQAVLFALRKEPQ